MTSFAYRGRDARGVLVQGLVEAADDSAAADILLSRGVTPVDLTLESKGHNLWNSLKAQGHKVTDEDIMFFSRQMYTLLKAGVPILQALGGLRDSATNPAFAEVVTRVRDRLDAGHELSMALHESSAFSGFYVQMVRVGEATGRLEEVFLSLFGHLRFEKEMRSRIKAALRYPGFVVVALAVALGVINWLVIPAFASVFRSFKAELPLMTRVLLGVSEFCVNYWWAVLLIVAALVMGVRAFLANTRGRLWWDEHKLALPVIGSTIRKATLARFARSFSLALSSGLPVLQAFAVVSQVVDNTFLSARIDAMRNGVERGESILRVAAASGVFTPVVLQMIAVGEESGAVDDLLLEVAGMYEREVDYEIDTLSARIEPILIVFLGAIVLVMALGIFLPIWDLSSTMMGRR